MKTLQMKRWSHGLVQAVALMSLGFALCLGAAESKTAAEPWRSLFNGQDLTGWKIVALTNPATAVVEDGAMVLRQRINTVEHTFVTSEQEYDDFILELDVKDDHDFNSGILLRCVEAPADAKVRRNGYQVKIDNTPRAWTGGIFDDFGDSWTWLHDLADNERGRAAFKMGEWAHFRIECIGSTNKVWVNGVPTCHLVDEKYWKGCIAFKIHSVGNNPKATESVIRFKNIRIITAQPERYAMPMRPARVWVGSFGSIIMTDCISHWSTGLRLRFTLVWICHLLYLGRWRSERRLIDGNVTISHLLTRQNKKQDERRCCYYRIQA